MVNNVIVTDTLTVVDILMTPSSFADTSAETVSSGRSVVSFNCTPNPFNSNTVISFILAENSTVKVVIYNQIGQEVVRLTDEWMAAGTHRVKWDALDSPSGIYFVSITCDNFSRVEKLLLIK